MAEKKIGSRTITPAAYREWGYPDKESTVVVGWWGDMIG